MKWNNLWEGSHELATRYQKLAGKFMSNIYTKNCDLFAWDGKVNGNTLKGAMQKHGFKYRYT